MKKSISKLNPKHGLTLIEVVITITVLGIIVGIGSLSLFGVRSGQRLNNDAKAMVAFLRDAQQRSITQENGQGWGIHFKQMAPQGYDLFSGVSYPGTVVSTRLLGEGIRFDVVPGMDVQFERLNGAAVNGAAVIRIRIASANCNTEPTKCREIAITANGAISYE